MPGEGSRSRAARLAAETALVRVVHHYGERPEFVLMGGLMPDYLCSGSSYHHAGTTDVDVQVDLEIARGTVNVRRLENALRNAEFQPDSENVWRCRRQTANDRSPRERKTAPATPRGSADVPAWACVRRCA